MSITKREQTRTYRQQATGYSWEREVGKGKAGAVYEINEPQRHHAQSGEYRQCFIITVSGV